jgi:hypothetical protein
MLLFCDSFDHYAGVAVGTKGWSQRSQPSAALDTTTGRFGSTAWWMNSRRLERSLPGNYDTIFCGFAFLPDGGSGEEGMLCLLDSGTLQVFVRYSHAAGEWKAFRGSGSNQIGATVVSKLANSTWSYIEMRFVIDNAAGEVEVLVNGTQIVNITGVDTQNTANAYVNGFRLGDDGDDFTFHAFDDLYILDDVDSGVVGAPNNDFLGDVRVQVRLPDNNGNSSQWVGSDGNSTNNYQLVDETAPNNDTDYVEASSVGNKDTYSFQDMTATSGTVYGVQVSPYARKTDAGTKEIVAVSRLATVEEDSSASALTADYIYYPKVFEANPDGDQWEIADVNSAEFGVKVDT